MSHEEEDDILEQAMESGNAVVKPISPMEGRTALTGMYRDWFLEFASYVILERAVPHIEDGLKPVQRRIMHSLHTLDDGRFNKVANIVGNTMQYHPHGDASITDALVQLGQKDLLVDTQGNWGNIITGDSAAASRYIEARLSEFALEAVFSPKVTEWTPTYDGRKKEPVTLPVKFPLLLAQGVEGIAVGLSSKILPHNFNEILDAAVSVLKGEDFVLYPDFQTGGLMDVSRYNDGARGGSIKVRAKIEKIDNKTLAITEMPFSQTTPKLVASILAAMEKGLIKIRKVDDHTSADLKIIVHLIPGSSSDKAIDALYAFTSCEESISPNCCVIVDKKPQFMSVSDLLRHSVAHTKNLLLRELEIKLAETRQERMFLSLEKIFISERIYKDEELEKAPDMETAVAHIDKRISPYKDMFYRAVTRDDIMRLWEIKMGRILKFNVEKADEKIAALDALIEQTEYEMEHITDYTIRWYEHLKQKYGARYPRRTVIRGFDSIQATKVAEANKRLYFDPQGNFIGTGLKDSEFLFTCSDIDDIIVFFKNGRYKIMKVQEKMYLGKDAVIKGGIRLYKKGDKRTIYNVIYQNGKGGPCYKKRFYVTGVSRDKEYDLTKGRAGSVVKYFSANPNGEAEIVTVHLKPGLGQLGARKMRVYEFDVDFASIDIKGKEALGNIVTKAEVQRVTLKEAGTSTLGGREVWYDKDVLRLNYDGRGRSLGVFEGRDKVLVITRSGQYYTTDFSDHNHYPDDILRIEKYDPHKIWTLAFKNGDALGMPYLKRFIPEPGERPQRFVGSDERSSIILLTDTPHARLEVAFGGADEVRPHMIIESDEFIAVKSGKAKGKRISTYEISEIVEIEPTIVDEEPRDSKNEAEIVEVEDVDIADVHVVHHAEEEDDESKDEKMVQGNLFDE